MVVNVHRSQKAGAEVRICIGGGRFVKICPEKGQPVICSMKPGDFTTTGHFIVLTGLTDDGKLMINDPNSVTRSEKRWDIDTIVGQAKSAWTYTVP